jgi:nicotinamide-nucleotide amidase
VNAEIVAIGTELLLGEIVDTNSARIARALRDIGLDLLWISAVGDNEARIAELVNQARRRSAVVITSGGLGPTVDDPTRAAIAHAFDVELEYRPDLWEQIEARYKRFGRTPSENNRKQAYVPVGALSLENPVGTAPCFVVEHENGVVIALPGVPRELDYMLENAVVPLLREKYALSGVIRARVLRTVGIGESLIDARISELEALSNPTVGLAAHAGQTDVRITAKAATVADAEALIEPIAHEIRRRLGSFVYAEGSASVEDVVCRMLVERGMTVAVAESGFSSRLGERLKKADTSNRVHVAKGLGPSAESSPCDAETLAKAARMRGAQSTDWGLAICGLQTSDGVRWQLALANADGAEQQALGYGGHPELAALWASTSAINLLRLALLNRGEHKDG